jgi:hypothetical protein
MPFERITTTQWRLDKDTRMVLGALIVYLRNEYIAGATLGPDAESHEKYGSIEGSAINYKKMIECCNRILSRIDGRFDAVKLATCMNIISRATIMSGGDHISKKSIEEATDHYGTLAPYQSRDRIQGEGSDSVVSEAGTFTPVSIDCDGGGGSDHRPDEYDRPGRPTIDAPDSQGTAAGDRHSNPHEQGREHPRYIPDSGDDYIPGASER